MTYGQCLNALKTGEIVIADIAGEKIEVLICAVEFRRAVEHVGGYNGLKGDAYYTMDCVEKNSACHLRMAPERLTLQDEYIKKQLDEIELKGKDEK